ncbi:MAG TPA: M3 family oligoendopeptidase [Acidimicrobiia bacterium]|nr:M3 family oligoendopeptidase [Acidimicrobiia bacterium]
MTPAPAERFSDVSATTPDFDTLAITIGELEASVSGADSVDVCLAAIRAWDAIRREVQTYSALVGLRFQQDTTDPDRKRAREAWDEAEPQWTELEVVMKRALLGHPRRAELEAELGTQAFALWESDVLAFDPAIKGDLARETRIGAEYVELLASAELAFDGEVLNLSSINRYRQSPDRAVRHAAERVFWEWFAAQRADLDRIFDDLVQLRTSMAAQLGFDDFVGLGYRRMCRVDYDRADVEALRAAVREHVVPFAAEIRRRQAGVLGLDRVMAWDEPVHDPAGNPAPRGDHDWMLARAAEMFDAMGDLGPFFRRMERGGFLDLADRKGKAGGGFCTSFPTEGMPFVFANFNGTKGDVEVFSHEMGHAFQSYESRDLPLSDYLWPTYESAEIHSMSLEFLTWPHMERFFGADADRFRRVHLAEALLFLPYGTAVDHFQHEIYAHPTMSPAERHDLWRSMEQTYLPWRDWGDLAYPAQGGRWQHQRHIYLAPFYYIDYVLAQTCALQFWVRAERDRDAAMADYVALCRRGGEAPFRGLVASAGLASPFEEGCLAEVVEAARAALA